MSDRIADVWGGRASCARMSTTPCAGGMAGDHALLDEFCDLHKQTLNQVKWLKIRLKEGSPRVLVVSV